MPKTVIDSPQAMAISVYPNPSKGTFTFSIAGVQEESDLNVKIEDLSGRIIDEFKRHVQPGKNESFIWDAATVSGGIYYYRAKLNTGKTVTGKLVKL